MRWDAEEELLLFDLFDYSLSHSPIEVDHAITRLSIVLDNKGKKDNHGRVDIYHLPSGLKERLRHIQYLVSGGEVGVESPVLLDEVFYSCYKDDPSSFKEQAQKVKEKYSCFYSGEEPRTKGDSINTSKPPAPDQLLTLYTTSDTGEPCPGVAFQEQSGHLKEDGFVPCENEESVSETTSQEQSGLQAEENEAAPCEIEEQVAETASQEQSELQVEEKKAASCEIEEQVFETASQEQSGLQAEENEAAPCEIEEQVAETTSQEQSELLQIEEKELASGEGGELHSDANQSQPGENNLDDISYAERYNLNPDEFMATPLEEYEFSVRVYNRLKSRKINTLGDLMRCTRTSIASLKGLGKNSIAEIDDFFRKAQKEGVKLHSQDETLQCYSDITTSDTLVNYIRDNYSQMLSDEESFWKAAYEFAEEDVVDRYKEAVSTIGSEMVSFFAFSPESFLPIKEAICGFVSETELYKRNREKIKSQLDSVPTDRWDHKAAFYIQAYTSKDAVKEKLEMLCSDRDTSLYEMTCSPRLIDSSLCIALESFLSWCSFSIEDELTSLEKSVFANEKTGYVIKMRASKNTLEKTGRQLGVSRERVRQIEAKAQRTFNAWSSRHKLLQKICAVRDGDIILTPPELEDYFGDKTQSVVYLFANVHNPSGYTYDPQTDSFIIGESSISERVNAAVENLPEYISAGNLSKVALDLSEETDIPEELIIRAVNESYKLTGNTYHRSRISLANMYSEVLKTYYPNGMHVYDSAELTVFRQHVVADYGFSGMSENDRAISARIAGIGVQCGRGMYKARQDSYIPKELADRIHSFILDGAAVVLTSAIYAEFEEDLVASGLDNPYYLHGILHELYGNEFFFKKTYISKDGSSSTLYLDIVRYVKKAAFTVSKAELAKAFPGVSDIMFSFAFDDREILNYFGEYLYARHLNITAQEISFLKSTLNQLLSDKNPHHASELFDVVLNVRPEIAERNGITIPFRLFSVLNYLFGESYQFSRPFIALNGVSIGKPFERLKELVEDSEEIEVAEIQSFAKDNHFSIPNVLDLINSFNTTHVFKDAKTLVRLDSVGITKEKFTEIEKMISDEIGNETVIIAELKCIHSLGKIAFAWNEWLLYSLIKKWSNQLEIGTTSSQFRHATPLVARRGYLDSSHYQGLNEMSVIQVVQADNLDDIDSLISDYVLDE